MKNKLQTMIIVMACLFPIASPLRAEALAAPGFIGHSRAQAGTVFGFSSAAYLTEPGIWGALEITEEQGRSLSAAYLETWAKRIDEGVADAAAARAVQEAFKQRRDDILTPDQKELVALINQTITSLVATKGPGTVEKSEIHQEFLTSLRSSLTVEQIQNLDRCLGQAP